MAKVHAVDGSASEEGVYREQSQETKTILMHITVYA